MEELILKVEDLSKQYRLGQIGGTTLRYELMRRRAKRRGLEDPTRRIDAAPHKDDELFMALEGVSFEVKKGERVGIIGRNGAGKSTLLKLISRITAPSSGVIRLNGRVASMLEVGTGFSGELTGRENIYMNGAILGMTKKEIDAKLEDIIEFSECREFIDTPVRRYSSGMYVKLAFSVAAHLDSEIMIMDEVLAVGDMVFQKKCLDKMNEVSRADDRTVLYVSHNMSTIRELCSRVIVLSQGRLVFDGDVEEGIALYMKVGGANDTVIDYEQHTELRSCSNPALLILSASYIGKDSIFFSKGEKMKIRLNWLNIRNLSDLCLRVEILKADRTPVGSYLLYDFYSGNQNETCTAEFELGLDYFTSGQYMMKFVFFTRSSDGCSTDAARSQGLYFTIPGTNEPIRNHSTWGPVEFMNIQLLSCNRKECDSANN